MKIYLKHILNSIRKAPLQPILVILTLIISTATLITGVKISFGITEEFSKYRNSDNYVADISVKLSSKSQERVLHKKELQKLIGNGGEVLGEFTLTGIVSNGKENEYIDISAVDLEEANAFYDIKYFEYRSFTDESLSRSIIISNKAAHRYEKEIGDEVVIRVLNQNLTFTIEAIAVDDGLLRESEWLCDISAVSRYIAQENAMVGALADTIEPYSALRVKVFDKAQISHYANLISESEHFGDKLVVVESENTGGADFFSLVSNVITFFATSVVILLSAIVISTSIELIRLKRRRETALFMISGAARRDLIKMNVAEYLLYSLVASVIALPLAFLMVAKAESMFGWSYYKGGIFARDFIVGFLGAPAILIGVYFITELRAKKLMISDLLGDERSVSDKKGDAPVYISASLFVVLLSLLFLVKTEAKVLFAIATFTSLIFLLYFGFPKFAKALSRGLTKVLERFPKTPTKLLIVTKELSASHNVMHSTRMITILLALLLSICACLSVLTEQTELVENLLDFDYVVVGADKKCDEIVSELDVTEDVFKMCILSEILNDENSSAFGFSLDENGYQYLNPQATPSRLPKNDEVVLTIGLSKLLDADVGDFITLTYETKPYTVRVIEVIDLTPNILFVDATYFGESNDLLCVRTKEVTDTEAFASISSVTEARGASLATRYNLLSVHTETPKVYARFLIFLVLITSVTAIIGIANSFISGYIESENDRAIYRSVGMTDRELQKTELLRLLMAFIVAIMIAIPIAICILNVFDLGVNSFGLDIIH